ncbi:hypothetical protein BD311DRAFT_864373 [Dichomitus squalens]|uniref:Telomere-associated protein Rif1 N-terminal domain-containing protein n=1 Tax=Dichomitus squalens TaxID=114155 RepID=A0A4Q9MQ83_9APHY|nr:hypothetical protein BD311DRAFT_864373 [Dichomitus squalens]
MSLPTPPGTSHRDEKENRAPRFARVSWSDTAELHPITDSPPRTSSARSSGSKAGPSRSILKKTTYPSLPPIDEDATQKESTPEPEDPLADLRYLERPMARIISPEASLCDLIQAYTSLAARLRNCVTGNTDADASWPLFQPLRKHRRSFIEAMVRDLNQVFVDPLEGAAPTSVIDLLSSPTREPPSTASLPSPRDSPKKTKKRGMSEEQVKRARDLCGVCQAVMRLLSVIFTLPSLYNLFNEEELGYVFTQVLAIPLVNELPTPNARKTYALAIWLIQVQRLPAEVLEPAKNRIAYALRRGIGGELGKEGKKGSVSDGLKAVHDLALYQPAIFVPAFVSVLGRILDNLLAPTLVMRGQACHALGGLALAAASLPPSEAHTRMSTIVASRLMKSADASPATPSKKLEASPSKDSILVRTLRTTLQAAEPRHSAQGPVWAFSVIAHLIVLLGPTVYLHPELTRTISALFSLGMRHTKSSVRALGCLAWRSMTWAFCRPPHVKVAIDTESDGEDESATEEDVVSERRRHDEVLRSNFKLLPSIVDMGAGVSTVGALLGQEVMDDMSVIGALRVLRTMSRKGGVTCKDAMDLTRHLLSAASLAYGTTEESNWNHRKLLVHDFFSANPGLLTAEWKTLSSAVKPLIGQCPQISDVRTLSLDEISAEGMWDEFVAIWRDGLAVLRLSWGSEEVPTEVREIWFNLLKCRAAPLLDSDDLDGLAELAANTRDVLVGILDDPKLDFTLNRDDDHDVPASPVKQAGVPENVKGTDRPLPESRWNFAVKLFLVRDLFTITCAIFPPEVFSDLAESVLRYLNANEEFLVGDVQCSDEVREQWACLCAEAAFACDLNVVQSFWDNSLHKARRDSDWEADVRASVWQAFVDRWNKGDASGERSWEAAIILLSAPFIEPSCWDMASDDLDTWDSLLRRAIDAALDHGIDATILIDQLAGVIATGHSPSTPSAVRVADLLLSNVEIADARQTPTEIFEFANDTLNAAYPPAPRHKVMCMWFLRTLTRVIDACPQELCSSVLELLLDGLRAWIGDDFEVCSEEEYVADILPLYQTVLVSMQPLGKEWDVLDALGSLLAAPFYGRRNKHTGAVDAFSEFWQATYAELPEPSCGYPESIVICLDAVAQAKREEEEDAMKVENMTVICDDLPSPSLEVAPEDDTAPESEDEGSVVIPSPVIPARASTPFLKFAISREPSPVAPVPSTPKRSPVMRTSPSRPEKLDVKDQLSAIPLDVSPSVDASPNHSPATPKRSAAKKDKENRSPRSAIASVTERLAARSPFLLESILGKRPRYDDTEDMASLDEKLSKKGRLEASPLAPSAFSNLQVYTTMHDTSDTLQQLALPNKSTAKIETSSAESHDDNASVASDAESETSAVDATPTPASRKRKGVFMDAVEVPSVQQIRDRGRHSLESIGHASEADAELKPRSAAEDPKPTIRRTRSATKLLGKNADFQKLETPKRRKTTRAAELREEAAGMSSPIRLLLDAPQFGSDDSIMATSPAIDVSDMPPSDDDPHLGQVTPHRLVSPSLRRVKRMAFTSSDPPSDDSNMSNSPSRDRVSRRTAWLKSKHFSSSKLFPRNSRSRTSATPSSSSALGSDS